MKTAKYIVALTFSLLFGVALYLWISITFYDQYDFYREKDAIYSEYHNLESDEKIIPEAIKKRIASHSGYDTSGQRIPTQIISRLSINYGMNVYNHRKHGYKPFHKLVWHALFSYYFDEDVIYALYCKGRRIRNSQGLVAAAEGIFDKKLPELTDEELSILLREAFRRLDSNSKSR